MSSIFFFFCFYERREKFHNRGEGKGKGEGENFTSQYHHQQQQLHPVANSIIMSNDNQPSDDFTRRPNPKGWTAPKAPYNPYDPNDIRPAEGYPSEYKIPGQEPSGFSSIPKNPTQYQKINEIMERLNYTARPQSDLYPGQYKVLRKIETNKRLNLGSRYFGTLIMSGISIYALFFHRWNEGRENVFSDFYRFQLKLKEQLLGGLNELDYDDLYHPKAAGIVVKNVPDAVYIPDDMKKTKETEYNLNRPSEKHVLEAQRIQQQNEERMLKELDYHKEFAKSFMKENDISVENQDVLVVPNQDQKPRKKWFGIF